MSAAQKTTLCFRLSMRSHLSRLREQRAQRKRHLMFGLIYQQGRVYVSMDCTEDHRLYWIVWTESERMGYVTIISDWDDPSAAKYSASLLYLRLRRQEAIRAVETNS